MQIYLSATQVATADNCRRQHWYQSIRKVKVIAPAANLSFGKCLDISVREYLRALALGEPVPDPVARFCALWWEARTASPLTYASTQTPASFESMGVDLMRSLPGAWEQTGFQIAHDAAGRPLLDVSLKVSLGKRGGVEIVLTGVIDVIVYTKDIELAIVDVKSGAAAHTALYAQRSDQLTCYQMLFGAHRETLGLPPLAQLGFWDFLKRKNARVEEPVLVPLRSSGDMLEFREKLHWLTEDVIHGRFPKVSRMQFNTPCEMCEFVRACIDDDEEGLTFTGNAPKKPARPAAPLTTAT